jgi:hypothetical protein
MKNQKEYNKNYYEIHKDEQKEKREKNKDDINRRRREWRENNKGHVKKVKDEWRKNNKEKVAEYDRRLYERLKLEILSYYQSDLECHGIDGKGCPSKCEDIRCLTLDHINGNGTNHRKELNRQGKGIYQWIKIKNYPPEFQVLCYNCNCGIKRTMDMVKRRRN